MTDIKEIQQILPLPILKLTEQYVGDKICLDDWVYNIMLDLLVEHIKIKSERANYALLHELIDGGALELVIDILDRIDEMGYIWEVVYTYIPNEWIDLFLDRYGENIIEAGWEPDNNWIEEAKEEYAYKINKLKELQNKLNY